jgi:hypothetical protein
MVDYSDKAYSVAGSKRRFTQKLDDRQSPKKEDYINESYTIVRTIHSWIQFTSCQRKTTLCNPAFLVKCHMDYFLNLPAVYLNCLPVQTTGLHHFAKKNVLKPSNVSRRTSHGLCPETPVYCLTRYKHTCIFQGRCSLHHPHFLLDLHSHFVCNVFPTRLP